MKHFARLTTVFILSVLSFNALAQEGKYVKLLRGQLNPFDTAVAVQIDQYRLETKKLKLADAVINNQDSVTLSLIERNRICDSLLAGMDIRVLLLTRRLARKDTLIAQSESDLMLSLNQIQRQEQKLASPFRKPWVWLAVGLGAGLLIFR